MATFPGKNWLQSNADPMLTVGLGLLAGKNPQEQVGLAASNFTNERKLNKTVQYLKSVDPELGNYAENNLIPVDEAFKLFIARKNEAAKPKNDYMAVGKNLFNKDTGEWISPPAGMAEADTPEYGLNPQYGVDANGNPVILQLSKGGTSKQTALPEGVTLSKEPIRLDAGTHFVLLDPITRQPIGQVPKNLAEAEAQKEIGTAQGKAQAAAPGDLQAGMNAKDLIRSIREDQGREWGTGKTSIFNSMPGTSGYDFQRKVDQAKSGAFLTAIQQMRGLGALSNAEGQAATDAVTRMDTAQTEEGFLAALADYERIVDQGIARAQSKIGGGNRTSGGVQWSVEP